MIRASDPAGEPGSRGGGDTIFDLEPNVLGTRGYRFTLEVRVGGRAPYEVTGRYNVPRRAENVSLLDTHNALKPGLELPVRVAVDDPQRVEVDWDRFLAAPGRKKAVKAASDTGRRARAAEQLARNPKLQAKLRSNNRMALDAWVEAVKAGSLSREEFDQTVTIELEAGRMDPADAEAARAALGGPG